MKNYNLKVSASLLERVANGENTVNLQDCVVVSVVNIVSEKYEQATSVLCSGIELADGKFNPLQLFKELDYTVIEWFDEGKPDYVETLFKEENKQSFFVILNESGFVMKVAYGLTDTVDFGCDGWCLKFTAKPCCNLNDNMVSGFEHAFKKKGYEVTLKR